MSSSVLTYAIQYGAGVEFYLRDADMQSSEKYSSVQFYWTTKKRRALGFNEKEDAAHFISKYLSHVDNPVIVNKTINPYALLYHGGG